MYKKIAFLVILALAVNFLISSKSKKEDSSKLRDDSTSTIFKSQSEAELACQKWVSQGGSWELMVDEITINDSIQDKDPKLPININKSRNVSGANPDNNEEDGNLTFSLPLLTYGNTPNAESDRERDLFKSFSWVKYPIRNCRRHLIDNQLIIGEEYSVKPGTRVPANKMPSLKVTNTFVF